VANEELEEVEAGDQGLLGAAAKDKDEGILLFC